MPTRYITIKANGRVKNGNARIDLSQSSDTIRWKTASGNGPWKVVFDANNPGSGNRPFGANTFNVPNGGQSPSTGRPVNGVINERYKYSVRDGAGNIVDDPDIIIET